MTYREYMTCHEYDIRLPLTIKFSRIIDDNYCEQESLPNEDVTRYREDSDDDGVYMGLVKIKSSSRKPKRFFLCSKDLYEWFPELKDYDEFWLSLTRTPRSQAVHVTGVSWLDCEALVDGQRVELLISTAQLIQNIWDNGGAFWVQVQVEDS